MKKYYLILMLFALPFMVQAQTEFKKLYEIFKDKKGVTIVQLDQDLIDLYKKSHLEKETEELIRKLKTVNILNVRIDKKEHTPESIDKLVKKSFNFNNFKIIKSSNNYRGFSKVYVKKKDSKVSSLVVINSGWREYNLILITGDIELSSLSKLALALNIDGLENLHKVGETRSHSFHHNYHGLNDEDIDKIKRKAEEFKKRLKEKKFFKGEKFNAEEFEKYMENFGKVMEELGEKLEERIETMVHTVIVDDDDFNISQNRSGKTTIKISPDNKSIYIVDGNIVANSEIKEIEAGNINRVSVIKDSKDKDGDSYVIIYTDKHCGEFISFQTGLLKFKYLGKTYKYDVTDKNFPGFVVNGKKRDNLDDVTLDKITQIRPITKAEKEALKCKKDRILIETK